MELDIAAAAAASEMAEEDAARATADAAEQEADAAEQEADAAEQEAAWEAQRGGGCRTDLGKPKACQTPRTAP
jgi:hypothetical protein